MSYSPANPKVTMKIDGILRANHPALRKVRWACIFVDRRAVCPYPVWAVLSTPASRSVGTPDILIHIDLPAWEAADEDSRNAWVDHCLSGLTTVEKNGQIQNDGANRPIVHKVRAPIRVELFPSVVDRHGKASFPLIATNSVLSLATENGLWDIESERRATRRAAAKPHPDFKRAPRTSSHAATSVIR